MSTTDINLAHLISRIRSMIVDPSDTVLSDDVVSEGIREALGMYSQAIPLSAIGTITVPADGRELDISALTGLVAVNQVWLPYDADDPEHPPNARNFAHWFDEQILYFPDWWEPQADDVARIFYEKLHTLDGLDGETTTSWNLAHTDALVTGAAGFSVASRARELLELVTKDSRTPRDTETWARTRIGDFQKWLSRIAASENARRSGHIRLPRLDRYDRAGYGAGRGWQ